MNWIKTLFVKNKKYILYIGFGICSSIVNWGSYYLCYQIAKAPNVLSTIVAWLLAVVVAFITNKLWVFESRSFSANILFREACTFFLGRVLTGTIDVLIMWVAVDLLFQNSLLWKVISNIIIILLNYIFSKIIVFRNK